MSLALCLNTGSALAYIQVVAHDFIKCFCCEREHAHVVTLFLKLNVKVH